MSEQPSGSKPVEGERFYEESGEHGRAGYYVKTVGNAPVAAPTALSAEEVAAKAAPKRAGSGSAWNTGGTWENKDVSKWAKTALPPLLEGLSVGDISVRSASVTGDASCVMVRGKLRPGFDVELELEWILPGEPPPAEAEPEPPPAEAEPEPPTETPAAEGSVEGDAGDADIDGDDDDDDDDDDDVPAEKDDGSTRGKITIAATDLDDEDDLVLSDIKVTKGDMEPYDAGKLLDGLREPVYEQLQAFKQAIVASCSG